MQKFRADYLQQFSLLLLVFKTQILICSLLKRLVPSEVNFCCSLRPDTLNYMFFWSESLTTALVIFVATLILWFLVLLEIFCSILCSAFIALLAIVLLVIVLLFQTCQNWRAQLPQPSPALMFLVQFRFWLLNKSFCTLTPDIPVFMRPDSARHKIQRYNRNKENALSISRSLITVEDNLYM